MSSKSLKTMALLSTVAVLTLTATHADARERSSTWTNSRGGSGTTHATRTTDREAKTTAATRTTTNAAGKTATTTSTGAKTETGYSGSSIRTGSNGNSVTSTKDVTKTDSGYDVDKTVTTSGGKTVYTDGSVSKGEDGGLNKTGTYTTGSGNTGTYYQNTDKTENGRTTSAGIVTQNGQTATKETVSQHQDGTWSKDSTTTGIRGKIRERAASGTYSHTVNP